MGMESNRFEATAVVAAAVFGVIGDHRWLIKNIVNDSCAPQQKTYKMICDRFRITFWRDVDAELH